MMTAVSSVAIACEVVFILVAAHIIVNVQNGAICARLGETAERKATAIFFMLLGLTTVCCIILAIGEWA